MSLLSAPNPAIPLDLLPTAALIADASGALVAANSMASALLGRTREELLQCRVNTPRDVVGEDGLPLAVEGWPMVQTLATGQPSERLVGLMQASGDRLWLNVSAMPLPDGGTLATFLDHTPQHHARTLLKARARIHEIAQRGTLEDVLRATLDETEDLTGSCIGFYHFVEADQVTLSLQAWSTRTAAHYCRAEGKGQHYGVDKAGVWVDAIRLGRAVIHNDYASLTHKKGLPEGHAALIRQLVVTVQQRGRIVAILGVGNKATDYTEQDVVRVQELADLAWEIADHKRTREWLKLRDQALEQSLNAFMLADAEGHLRHVNPAFLSSWGYRDRQDVLGRDRLDFWADREAARALGQEAIRKDQATADLLALRSDGSTFLAEARLSTAKDAQGRLLAMLGTASDVSAQRQALRDVQEQKEALEQFFQTSVDLLCLANTEGRFLRVNDAWSRLLGYPPQELENSLFLDLVHAEDLPATLEAIAHLAQGQPVIDFVNRYRAMDGTWHNLEWRALARDGIIYAGARDITDRLASEADLRRSTELLQESQQLAQVGGWELDPATGALYWTDETFRIHDLEPNAAMPTVEEAVAFYAPDSRPIIAQAVQRALEDGTPFRLDLELDTALGHRIWVRASGHATRQEGQKTVISGAFQDITEQKTSEAKLKEAFELFSAFLAHSPIYAFIKEVTATESRVILASDNFVDLVGIPGREMMGKNMTELFPADFAAKITADDWRTVQNGEVLRLDEGLFGKHYTTIKFPLMQGDRILLAGYTIDITEREQDAEALRALNERLALVSEAVAQSPSSVVISDAAGTIEYVNPAFERATGYSAAEALGQNPRILKSGEQDSAFYHQIWTTLEQGKTWEGRFCNRRKDGSHFWEQARISPVKDENGEVRHYLAIKEDITESLRLAEEHKRLEAQLLQSQKLESLGSLAGGVAHDMNNVLMAILGLSTALKASESVGSPRARSFDTIISACQKGGRMVRSLLDFARQGAEERRLLDLNSVIGEEVALLERTTFQRVKVETRLEPNLPAVFGDSSALSHALMNLCVNAVDAMEADGVLTLETRSEEGWVICTVTDTGCGMSPEVLARALEPYFTTKPEGKGTGLGLAMAFGTLQAHDGTLSIASTLGVGTTITLRLPAARTDTPPAELAQEGPDQGLSIRILVVDDDDLVRLSTESLLELMGAEVELATCGEDALARLSRLPQPDLVILDMNMPGLGGAGTLPRLRELAPKLPVLLATGRADPSAKALVDAHPGVRLLPKPFGMSELRAALELLPSHHSHP